MTGYVRHGHARQGARTREWKAWANMRRRVLHPWNEKVRREYAHVTIDPSWIDSFETFLQDMGLAPTLKHELDRVDGTKGYGPTNCRWATRIEQANNVKDNRRVDFEGVTRTASEWARYLGLPRTSVSGRLNRGWTVREALTIPAGGRR